MSAPKKIYALFHKDGNLYGSMKSLGEAKEWVADSPGANAIVETYVHASELEAVQARLDKLVEAAEYMRDDICEGEHDEAMLKLKSAIAAAKGE